MFGLAAADLRGLLLDCPGGAGSFAAAVRSRGGRIVSVDPSYRLRPVEVASLVRSDVDRGNGYVAAHLHDYRWSFFPSLAQHHEARQTAAEAFLEDFTTRRGGYVAGALPRLPFADRTFDLVLSAHLLFTYGDRLDRRFHRASLLELVRVARREARVFPLVDSRSRPHPDLDALRAGLRSAGIETEVRTVGYEFQRGGNQMLACRTPG